MSKELIFLPIDFMDDSRGYSHQVLQFGSNYDFFDELEKLNSMPVCKDFTSFVSRQGLPGMSEEDIPSDSHYGITTEDDYGHEVRYVLAGELVALISKFPKENWSLRQQAAIAYISVLPENHKVALTFH